MEINFFYQWIFAFSSLKECFYPAKEELSKNQKFGLISYGQYDLNPFYLDFS